MFECATKKTGKTLAEQNVCVFVCVFKDFTQEIYKMKKDMCVRKVYLHLIAPSKRLRGQKKRLNDRKFP